ncbi:hypothetical protein B0E34_08925 [Chryseobacterium mucoviscidosis]|uniref:Uncharacterized protein n=1 Tax=Chryseobacterium mucoviscidosis TaxID=1945581 RepID=A0A202C298_9FLAO|nr:hypothetical protein B0E34_08925 [Chryseobacterium mucoviscidosis]
MFFNLNYHSPIKNHSEFSRNPSTVVRPFFGKNPIFPKPIRRRPEHDPKKWVFKPVKTGQNRSKAVKTGHLFHRCLKLENSVIPSFC